MYNWTEPRLNTEFNKKLEGLLDDANPEMGGNVNFNGYAFYDIFTVGENIGKHTLCYMNAAGKMVKAGATSDTLSNNLIGLSANTYGADELGVFFIMGVVAMTGFNPGQILYVSTQDGMIQKSPPQGGSEIVRIVGYGLPSDTIFFNPDRTWIELEP